VIRRHRLAVVLVTLVACHSASSASTASTASGDNASVVAFTPCAASSSIARNAVATLSIKFRPAPAAGASVKIQVEGETTKSITRDSTDQLHRFELARGLYDVRISMPGFSTATSRITLTAGCTAELSATLRPRVK